MTFHGETIARSQREVEPSNEGTDIDAVIAAARQKLSGLDTAAARSLLASKIAEEEEARRQRLVPLLEEKAAIEKLSYDDESAKAMLRQLPALAPDSVAALREVGLVCRTAVCVVDREEGGVDELARNAVRLRPLFTAATILAATGGAANPHG